MNGKSLLNWLTAMIRTAFLSAIVLISFLVSYKASSASSLSASPLQKFLCIELAHIYTSPTYTSSRNSSRDKPPPQPSSLIPQVTVEKRRALDVVSRVIKSSHNLPSSE
ncbi:MAG: hypothetical protein DRN15_10990 [Thermoprotei archaeon]|nr:MAG: hypothetical protein DRN15_10990 [Thermoprotei archaeon]